MRWFSNAGSGVAELVELLPGVSICLILGPLNVIVVLGFKLLPKHPLTDPFSPPVPSVCVVEHMRLHSVLIEEHLLFCHSTEDGPGHRVVLDVRPHLLLHKVVVLVTTLVVEGKEVGAEGYLRQGVVTNPTADNKEWGGGGGGGGGAFMTI